MKKILLFMKSKAAFIFVLFVGLVIRLFLVGNPGFEADISFWKSWSLAAIDHGIVWTSINTNINYPPGFIYVLWLMGKIYTLLGNSRDYYTFWRVNNFGFLFASKSIAIISDIIIAILIYHFFSQKERIEKLGGKISRGLPLLLASIFYLNPVTLTDSAVWGQVESFGILFTLLSIILLFYKKPLLATAIFTVGPLMKLQNIIFIPLFFLFIYRYFDLKTLLKSLAVATLVFFTVVSPFVLANKLDQVLYLLTVNSDYFPWLSLNAHNLWWIVAGAKGMQVTDKITVLGIMNAKSVGLMLFSVSYLLSCLLLFFKPSPRNFILSLTFALFSFFLLTTQSHERYSYPIVVLLLFLYPFLEYNLLSRLKPQAQSASWRTKHKINPNVQNPKTDVILIPMSHLPAQAGREKNPNRLSIFNGILQFIPILHRDSFRMTFKRSDLGFRISNLYFWLLYFVFTTSIFFNIHTGLILNYPNNGINFLTTLTSPSLTVANSYLSILLYFLLFPYIFSQISLLFLPLLLLLLIGLFIRSQSDYLFRGRISLTKFKPIIITQDYGSFQVNKSINSMEGWKKWNRLSNNYFYYRKGFGTHANSNLVFDIDKKFRKFQVDFGVDTEAPTPATVVFQVHGDGKLLFESEKMGRFDFPSHAEIDVSGIKYLGLTVNDAGDGINSDHADWFNPVLYK